MAKIDDYLEKYKQLQSALIAPTINYTPTSRDQYLADIQAALRPGYDLAIAQRQKQTDANKAELDVDAASRGMGASTWLSDVKDRQNRYESEDIATLESQYAAAQAQQLLNALQGEKANQLAADQFNASLLANRDATLLGLAGNFLSATKPGKTTKKSTDYDAVVKSFGYLVSDPTRIEDAKNYLANNIARGRITEDEAAEIAIKYGLYKK